MQKLTKYKLVEINSIETIQYNGMVYDLTIEDHHSYNVNGICVHNSICSTRTKTGFGIPTLTSIQDCKEVKSNNVYLIADGGISNEGDIAKAINAGADMVMLGKLFAGTSLSPGMKYTKDFEMSENQDEMKWVEYHGMASHNAQQSLDNTKIHSVEGVSGLIPYTGTTEFVTEVMFQRLRSSVGYYGGCKNWDEFRRFVKMIEITDGGREESGNSSIYIRN